MSSWYYFVGGKEHGPVPLEELKGLVARGALKAADEVWKEGTPDWTGVRSVPELREILPRAASVTSPTVPPGSAVSPALASPISSSPVTDPSRPGPEQEVVGQAEGEGDPRRARKSARPGRRSAVRRRVSGVLLIALAFALAGYVLYEDHLENIYDRERMNAFLPVRFLGVMVGSLAVPILFVLGRRCWTRTATEAVRRDRRGPILLLRSFEDDALRVTAAHNFFSWCFLPLMSLLAPRKVRFEEILSRGLRAYGPIIAIGDPQEIVPQLGAARLYVADEAWQNEVVRLLGECQFVGMLFASTEGILWELRQVAQRGDLGRLLLVIPPMGWTERQRRWGQWREILRAEAALSLPPVLPANSLFATWTPNGQWVVTVGSSQRAKDYRTALPTAVARLANVALNPSITAQEESSPDVAVDVCASHKASGGLRQLHFFTRSRNLVQTLERWKAQGIRDVWITWGKTAPDAIESVQTHLQRAGVDCRSPSKKRHASGLMKRVYLLVGGLLALLALASLPVGCIKGISLAEDWFEPGDHGPWGVGVVMGGAMFVLIGALARRVLKRIR